MNTFLYLLNNNVYHKTDTSRMMNHSINRLIPGLKNIIKTSAKKYK